MALKDILDVKAVLDPDRIMLECARVNSWSNGVDLVRTPLTGERCMRTLAEVRPEVLIGNACRRYDAHSPGETADLQVTEIVDTFTASRAQLLLVECPVGFARTPAWRDQLRPRLEKFRCTVEDATLYATDVGVPTGKQRVFIVAVKLRPGGSTATLVSKLTRWKQRLQQRVTTKPSVGALLGRQGFFFLKLSLIHI